jgi:hypothetical protein
MGRYLLSVVDEELELLQIAARTSAGRSPRLDAAYGALIDGLNGELAEWISASSPPAWRPSAERRSLAGYRGDPEVSGPRSQSVVEGGDRRAVLLGRVDDAAIGHLELGCGSKLAQAEGRASGKVQAFDTQLREELAKSLGLGRSGSGGAGVDLGQGDDAGGERVQPVSGQQCRRIGVMRVGRLEMPDQHAGI